MLYEITLDAYKGPLDKLLELVEGRELEITEISLATVTADFLKYVQGLSEAVQKNENLGTGLFIDPSILADFLVIASKLILIKSKNLIPALPLSAEEESDIRDLELRLRLYRELKKPQEHLRNLWSVGPKSLTREFLVGLGPVFYPPQKLKDEELKIALEQLLLVLRKTLKPVQTIRGEVINLKRKIEEILRKLTEAPTTLGKLRKSGTKGELVVMFLAILHLIKEQLVLVDQENNFEEIRIVKKDGPA